MQWLWFVSGATNETGDLIGMHGGLGQLYWVMSANTLDVDNRLSLHLVQPQPLGLSYLTGNSLSSWKRVWAPRPMQLITTSKSARSDKSLILRRRTSPPACNISASHTSVVIQADLALVQASFDNPTTSSGCLCVPGMEA